MADDDFERISAKAYEIWESEGRPHGRDRSHWDQAKEIIALHDSMGDTLLPRSTGSFEPEEQTQSTEPYGDMPGITDQGRGDLTDVGREPEITKPSHATHSTGDTAGHVARSVRDEDPDIDDDEVVTPAPEVAAVTPTPSNPTLGTPAPREAAERDPDLGGPQAITPKTAEAPPKPASSAPGLGIGSVGDGAATSGTTPTPAASPSDAKAPAGMANTSGQAPTAAPTSLPPTATGAGRPPGAPDDARLGSGLQASPIGNSAPVTGKNPPKTASSPTPVTKGRSSDRR